VVATGAMQLDTADNAPMTTEFVRYAPDIETIDPHLEELLPKIIAFWEKKGRESPETEGTGRAVRGAHAKALGVARADVEILDGVPEAYAQGIYGRPGHHGALIRYSSASNHLGPDMLLGPVLGFAIKLFGVEGRKLVDDEPDAPTFDLVLKNSPTFIANTAKHYLFIQEIGNDALKYLSRGKPGFRQLLTDFLTGKGTLQQDEWAWEELGAFLKAAQTPIRNPVSSTYWTMGAVRHGDHIAKVRVEPAPESASQVTHRQLDLGGGPDVLGPALAEELREHPFEYELQVQLCRDLEAMPVNDLTVDWPESLSPFVTVGRIHVPCQDVDAADFDKTDALAFNQWRVTDDHRPLGEIMQVRQIYSTSAKVRRLLNHQPLTEPTSAESVVP
jgi:hypothetical protein